jgi:microcystin-dependent protein
MSTPFIGQIQTFSFPFAPKGWAACNGQLLPINQNQALFSLLGTQYGGDGIQTFALPNLQGSFGLGQGTGYVVGQKGGELAHTLTVPELGTHTHPMVGSSANASASTPVGNFPAVPANGTAAFSASPNTQLGPGSSPSQGGGAHPNMPPFLVMNTCIALTGAFPSRN